MSFRDSDRLTSFHLSSCLRGAANLSLEQAWLFVQRPIGLVESPRRPLSMTSAGVHISHNGGLLIAPIRGMRLRVKGASKSEASCLHAEMVDSVVNTIEASVVIQFLQRAGGRSAWRSRRKSRALTSCGIQRANTGEQGWP
jgi:hypothetical protein